MENFQLIMVSAMYENGGNTTHRMLDGHPNLLVYPFESQLGTGAGADMFSSLVPIRYRWPEFPGDVTPATAYELFWDEELKTYLRAPKRSKFGTCGLEMSEDRRRQEFAAFLERKPLTRANLVEAFFRSTFAAWDNVNRTGEETHFVGYNPVQVLDTEKVLHDFGQAHILHVVRNPFSGYADTKKRPFPLSLERYAWTWNICQHMALTYQEKHRGRFHLLRFEDLAADPQLALTRVFEGMGLPWSRQCAYPSFNGRRLDQVHPWGTIRLPTTEANVATAKELTAEEAEHIKVECSALLGTLGYAGFLD